MKTLFWAALAMAILIMLFCFLWKLVLIVLSLVFLMYIVWKLFSSSAKEKYDDVFKKNLN
jgi:ABC-type bacteriocin/lantibiotic exporter with double-glycine peptidase domain